MDDREIAATAPPWFTGDIDGMLTKLEREVERVMLERRILVGALRAIADGYIKALETSEIPGHYREIARSALACVGVEA